MMVGVAAVALVLFASEVASRRQLEFRRRAGTAGLRARFAAKEAFENQLFIEDFQRERDKASGRQREHCGAEIDRLRRESVMARRFAEYFHRQRLKYEFAARYPFVPVSRDPPLPDSIE
jgi:hypothetical protein